MVQRLSRLFNEFSTPAPGWQEGYFTNPHGDTLRYGHAPAQDPENTRGTVVMTHGYGEHIELYYHAIRYYQERGFDVWMMEFQGHGKSGRHDPVCPVDGACGPAAVTAPRGMIAHMQDLEHFTTKVVEPIAGKPVIMSTNSMGGHIGLLALKNNPDMFDGAVMSTPMFDIYRLGLPPAARPLMHGLFSLLAKTPIGHMQLPGDIKVLNALTSIGNKVDDTNDYRREWNETARRRHADLQIDRPSPAWVASAYESIVPSLKTDFLRAVKTPMLVGAAGRDNLIDNAAITRVAEHTADTQVLSLPNAQHSLWFESNGNYRSWTASIDRFLDRIAPAKADDKTVQPDNAPQHMVPFVEAPQKTPPAWGAAV